MSQELGLRDVAEGLTDISVEGVSGPTLMGMDQATRDKMDIYSVPALTYTLFANPYPNKAPYVGEVNGKDFFNVMAINEFRYALNDLINRQYIVDEILGGAGGPKLSMATPGHGGTCNDFQSVQSSAELFYLPSGSMLYPAYSLQRLFPREAGIATWRDLR